MLNPIEIIGNSNEHKLKLIFKFEIRITNKFLLLLKFYYKFVIFLDIFALQKNVRNCKRTNSKTSIVAWKMTKE